MASDLVQPYLNDPSPSVPLEVTVRIDGTHTVLEVRGEVDLASAPTLGACLDQAVAEPSRSVILDLAGVSFLDSTGVNTVVRANNALVMSERQLIVRNPRPAVRQVFEITGVVGHVLVEPGRDPASP